MRMTRLILSLRLLLPGVLPACDITPEAALTKLSYVLSKDEWDIEKKREMMQTNLVGEITVLNLETTKEKTKQSELELIQVSESWPNCQ